MLHLLLFGCIIIKCLRHYKHLGFELSVMVFLLISMIGADPLATPDKHCFFYWLVIGRVASFKLAKQSERDDIIRNKFKICKMPKISIIIATFNAAKTLRTAKQKEMQH